MLGGIEENLGVNSALTAVCIRINTVDVNINQIVIKAALANTESY